MCIFAVLNVLYTSQIYIKLITELDTKLTQ